MKPLGRSWGKMPLRVTEDTLHRGPASQILLQRLLLETTACVASWAASFDSLIDSSVLRTAMKVSPVLLASCLGLMPAFMCAATTPVDTKSMTMINYDPSSPLTTTNTLSLSMFDPSLGTLTGVNISYYVNVTGASIQVDNDAGENNTATGSVFNTVYGFSSSLGSQSLLDASYSPIVSSSSLQVITSHSFDLAANSGDALGFTSHLGGDYGSYSFANLQGGGSGNVASSFIDLYKGTGSFDIDLQAMFGTIASFSGPNGFFQGNTASATITAAVQYTYNPIPEPSTYAMVFGAMTLGLVGWRRFRR